MNFQDIIHVCGDGSKAFVLNEQGDVKLVILGAREYQRLIGSSRRKQPFQDDVELINRRILEAQLQNDQPSSAQGPVAPPAKDMRSEVIDPNFDFDAEAIKPEFDDI